jgi:hypothetical protein
MSNKSGKKFLDLFFKFLFCISKTISYFYRMIKNTNTWRWQVSQSARL